VKRLVSRPMYPLKGTLFISGIEACIKFKFSFYSGVVEHFSPSLYLMDECACLMHACLCMWQSNACVSLCLAIWCMTVFVSVHNLSVPVWCMSVPVHESFCDCLMHVCACAWIFLCMSVPVHESLCSSDTELRECDSVCFPTSKEGRSSNWTVTALSQ